MSEFVDKVAEFRKAGGKLPFRLSPSDFDMIWGVIEEELNEFGEAMTEYQISDNETTRANLCKEWADLQYVVSQAADYFEIPDATAFELVHENNMTKVVDGKIRYREDGKILKPEGYQKPDMRGI